MNPTRCCLFAASFSLLVACGDSSSSGAGGSSTTSTTNATGSSSTGMSCGTLATKAACQTCCSTQEPVGSVKLIDKTTVACGCTANASCSTQCMNEAFCTDMSSKLSAGCDACIKGLGATAMCAASIASACSADKECAAALSCVVGCVSLP